VVGQDVVTSREVQISHAVAKAMETESKTDLKNFPNVEISVSDSRFADLTTSYLIEKATELEADSFSIAKPSEAEIKEMTSRVERVLTRKTYWQNLEPEASMVRRIIVTKLISSNFIKIKSDSMAGIITDTEAQSYFEKNRLKFGNASFDSFKENIKTFLIQQQRQERLRSWFEVLKKKFKIRNLLIENVKTPRPTPDSQNPSHGK
jgi:hypothetical protein